MPEENPSAMRFERDVIECADCGTAFSRDTHGTDCPDCSDTDQAGFDHFGADNDVDRESRVEHARDNEFVDGRDDGASDGGDQAELVTDTDEDQVTLGGESADARSKW